MCVAEAPGKKGRKGLCIVVVQISVNAACVVIVLRTLHRTVSRLE